MEVDSLEKLSRALRSSPSPFIEYIRYCRTSRWRIGEPCRGTARAWCANRANFASTDARKSHGADYRWRGARPARPRRAASAGNGCRARGRQRRRRCRGSRSCPRRAGSRARPARSRVRWTAAATAWPPLTRRMSRPRIALQHRRHQRVVGAAEDQGVDLGLAQRRAVGAGHRHHALVEGRAVLDERGQLRRLDLGHLERPPLRFQRPPVGAALDRVRRRQHADLAVGGDRGGDLGLRGDHRHHLHPAPAGDLAGDVLADRGRGVAGDHQQLGAAVEQQLGDRARSAPAAAPGRGSRRGTTRCRRGRGSPPGAARRGTRAGR